MDESNDLQPRGLPGEPASQIPCSVCQRDIPLSAAVWRESSDYVAHFCGLECYERWRSRPGGGEPA